VVVVEVPRYGAPPTLQYEREAWDAGHDVVVGMDEVGRGSWAGPIAVGAAVLPRGRRVNGVRDSKALPEARREELFDRVAAWCSDWHVGFASQVECDSLGMAQAQRLAASRALAGLGCVPDMVLVDGNWDFAGGGASRTIVHGDALSLSIAAASVLAKVTRDRHMRALAPSFPHYEFQANKGYPCWRHKMALQAYGPCVVHRRTWAFMDDLGWDMRYRREAGTGASGLCDGEDGSGQEGNATSQARVRGGVR